MKFKLEVLSDSRLKISFTSSKETVELGVLDFVDSDGDTREDIMQLLITVATNARTHPMFEVIE